MELDDKKVEEEKIKKMAITALEKWALEDLRNITSSVFTPAFFHTIEFPTKEIQALFHISPNKEKCLNELIFIAKSFCNSAQLEKLQAWMKKITREE